MQRLGEIWRMLDRYSGLLAVFVAIPVAVLSTVQCSMVRKDVERAEHLAAMTSQQLESARMTNAVQAEIADSAERATNASVRAMSASERYSERMVIAVERSTVAAERAARAAEQSVELQRAMLERSQR